MYRDPLPSVPMTVLCTRVQAPLRPQGKYNEFRRTTDATTHRRPRVGREYDLGIYSPR